MSVDTLSLAKELRTADFASPQAEAIAAAIGRAVIETSATKADLIELRGVIRTDLAEMRTDIAKLDTKIEAAVSRLLFWFAGIVFAAGGLAVAAIKLFPASA